MPADEQRKIAYFVLTGIALTAASGGLGMIANTGRGIQFGYALQRGAQTATAATRAGAQTTWAVSSDLATRTVVATAPVTLNPRMQETVIDFSTSLFPGAPAMSGAGAVGAAAGMITNPHEALR